MARKGITLRCYDIESISATYTKKDDIYTDFVEYLKSNVNVAARVLKYVDGERDGEIDCIANFIEQKQSIFCLFIRTHAGVPLQVTDEYLNNKSFEPETLTEDAGDDTLGFIKDHVYFLLTKKHLIMQSTKSVSDSDISIYIKSMLKRTAKYASNEAMFTVKPTIRPGFDRSMIKTLALKGLYKLDKNTAQTFTKKIGKALWHDLFSDAKDIKDFDPERIIDASVIITVKKPEKQTDEAVLKTFLNAVNLDNAIIKDKNNHEIKPDEIKLVSQTRVNYLANNYPDKMETLNEMEALLQEAKNAKKKRD